MILTSAIRRDQAPQEGVLLILILILILISQKAVRIWDGIKSKIMIKIKIKNHHPPFYAATHSFPSEVSAFVIPSLSSLTLFDDAEWKMGLGFIIGLIVFAAAIGAWRSLTGNDRQKADVRIESDFVTHTELDSRLGGLASEIERKFEKALHGEFKQLNGERSRSIAGLHGKVEETTSELRRELSDRINVVDGLVRQIQGELKHFFRNGGPHE